MNQYPVILFDLDGTLTDPEVGITTCVQYALHHFGVEVEDRRTLRPFIGPPLIDGFMEQCGFTREKAAAAASKYRERFSTVGLFENEVYPGIPEMLRMLKDSGHRLGVATCKPEHFARKIMEHFELDQYFDTVTGALLDGTRTTKGQVIRCALERLGAEPEEALMVGDRKYDIEGAQEEGLDSIGVLYGFGSEEEFRGAIGMAHSVEELGKMLR